MKKENLNLLLILAVLIAFIAVLYFTLSPVRCESFACFQDKMGSCSQATYINEEPEASFLYNIKRKYRDKCEIEVTLLQAKEGELKLRGLEKHSMLCTYPLGVIAYPDKDLSLCHGRLKEDLQGIIIEKLHTYIVNNLGSIKEALGNISINSS